VAFDFPAALTSKRPMKSDKERVSAGLRVYFPQKENRRFFERVLRLWCITFYSDTEDSG